MKAPTIITPARLSIFVVVCALVISTASCASRLNARGNLPDPKLVAEIKPGKQTRNQVAELLGSPSSVTPFGSNTWYYISKRTETFAFFEPKVTDRHIVEIKFGSDGKVTDVETFGLEAGQKIHPVERTTPTHGTEMTVLEQLIGNLGRFRKKNQKKGTEEPDPNLPNPYDQ